MKVLIFNHHPDCALYMYKAFKTIGFKVEFATEELTKKVGFNCSSTINNKFELVNKLFDPSELSAEFNNIVFSNNADHDIYLSILPEVFSFFGSKAYFDARMQNFIKNLGWIPCRKSCNHPDAKKYNFSFCSNWVPKQPSLKNPIFITQLITQAHLVDTTVDLFNLKKQGHPVQLAGGDNLPDGFKRDIEILPYTSLLVHNKTFGINCYAVCKALDMGIPVYMSKITKELIGFGDLPDSLFFFKEEISILDAYKKSLSIDRTVVQDTYRSIYTLDRTIKTLQDTLNESV